MFCRSLFSVLGCMFFIVSAGCGSMADISHGSATPREFVIVWAIGQSNVSGRANELSRIENPRGVAFAYRRATKSIDYMSDPTGNDSLSVSGQGKGSFGPALARAVYSYSEGRTGVILVNSGEGGTSLLSNWAANGSSWIQATMDLNATISIVNSTGIKVAGVVTYMQQGETDADNSVSKQQYIDAFESLKDRVDKSLGKDTPFFLTKIGAKSTGDTVEYAIIRDAQEVIGLKKIGVHLVPVDTFNFLKRHLMMDLFHYKIQGYEEIGFALGHAICLNVETCKKR